MREIVFDHVGVRYLLEELALVPYDERNPCIGVLRDGRPVGGVVYTGWTGSAIQIHMAGRDEKWVPRELLILAYHYPFVQLGVRCLIGIVNENNKVALSADLRMGFRIAAKVKYGFPDGDAVILTMYREDCPWLKHPLRQFQGNLAGMQPPVLYGSAL